MKHWPSENFAQQEPLQEIANLSPDLQKVLNDMMNQIKDNPEIAERVKSDFSNLFEELAKNPETAKILDAKVLEKMQSTLFEIKEKYSQGEIYSEEALENSKKAISQATLQRLQIFVAENNLQMP